MNNWFKLLLVLALTAGVTARSNADEGKKKYAGRCDVAFEGDSTLDRFSGNVTNLPLKVLCATNEAGKAILSTRLGISPYQLTTHNKKRDANMYKMFGADHFTNIVVVVQSDLEVEPDETFFVDLSNPSHASLCDRQVVVGVSPRGSLALLKLTRAWAAIKGRDFVIPDDVKTFARPALAHRLVLDPNLWGSKKTENSVIDHVIATVRVPVIQGPHE